MITDVIRRVLRNYPLIHGRDRLTRLLCRTMPVAADVVVPFDDDISLRLAMDQSVSQQIYWFGDFEPRASRLFAQKVLPGMVVFDVGANIGSYTVLAAKRVGPAGRVYAFEPSSANFDMLSANVVLNEFEDRTRLYNMALWSAKGILNMVCPADGAFCSVGGPADTLVGRETETIECTSVDAIVLAEKLERVDVIKIDAVGADFDVLKGAARTLQRFGPDLLMELTDVALARFGAGIDEALAFLADLGYRPHAFTPHGVQPLTHDIDISNANLYLTRTAWLDGAAARRPVGPIAAAGATA